jgi:hypothetical protein
MEQSPFWEANRSSDTKEITHFIWNSTVYYRVHKSPPSLPILNVPPHLTSLRSILILSSHLRCEYVKNIYEITGRRFCSVLCVLRTMSDPWEIWGTHEETLDAYTTVVTKKTETWNITAIWGSTNSFISRFGLRGHTSARKRYVWQHWKQCNIMLLLCFARFHNSLLRSLISDFCSFYVSVHAACCLLHWEAIWALEVRHTFVRKCVV